MDDLREKCPWDKKQTLESLRHLTIEETYELGDAILNNDLQEIDCVILANSKDLLLWIDWVQGRTDLRRATVLAYDSQLHLKQNKDGYYFMNSSIWVNTRQKSKSV
jgi:hypothetical protein